MNSKGLAQLAYEKGMYILTRRKVYQAALEAASSATACSLMLWLKTALNDGADNEPKRRRVSAAPNGCDFATERVPQMQEERLKQRPWPGAELAFTKAEQKITDLEQRSVQRPRVF